MTNLDNNIIKKKKSDKFVLALVATWSVLVSVETLLTSLQADTVSQRLAILGPVTEKNVNEPFMTVWCEGLVPAGPMSCCTSASPVFPRVSFSECKESFVIRVVDRTHCPILVIVQCWSSVLWKTTNTPQRGC